MTEAKERPTLFSGPMVRAILAGDKTQTRRVAKPARHPDLGNLYDPGALVLEGEPKQLIDRACPYCQPGDRLWVRETWSHANNRIAPYSPGVPVHYRADYLDELDGADRELAVGGKYRFWLPSIHMPRSACRLVLEIATIRVERLQQISCSDVRAEGTSPDKVRQFSLFGADAVQREQIYRDATVDPFRRLWEKINGTGAWHKDPWVWVIEFGVLIRHETEDR